jgi:hypothetical protein
VKADTFARLAALETLIDAEVGYWLEFHPASMDRYRETFVARVSDVVDEIDALDAVAAARVYDAIVDFLAELPEDDEGVVEAALRFKRTVDRMTDRAMQPRDLEAPETWAVVLDELLATLLDEYRRAVLGPDETDPRGWLRVRLLLARAREAAARLAPGARPDRRLELRDAMDRLAFAVTSRRVPAQALEPLVRAVRRIAERHRPSNLTRIGAFVVGQLLRPRGREKP